MDLTNKQIDRIGKILGHTRDAHELRELWNIRVLGSIDDTWDHLMELEKEVADVQRRLRRVSKVMKPDVRDDHD